MKYSVKDYEIYTQYVPMISLKFWEKLPENLQKILVDAWEAQVDQQRAMAQKMQAEAEDLLKQRGVTIFEPSKDTLAKWRRHIMPTQEPYAKKIGMDPELVNSAKSMLGM
jgi:C4-dicarboxylate-binding protein DctP